VRYPAFLQDNAAAVHWVRQHARKLGAYPDRIVLAGHSAGAYNAAMLALDPRWLGVDREAIKGLIGLVGPYDFLPFSGPIVERTFVGVTDQRANR
jgi:acetyl esterase/lipase